LIVAAKEDDDGLRIRGKRAGISVAQRYIPEQMRRYKEKRLDAVPSY
jgi:hypothetical protein